ncbi:MAG: TlpA disulfide reductase family protein [Haloferula sp.]
MKPFLITLATILLSVPALSLTPGNPVTPDALASADFLKGSPPKTWEAGKTYLINCWATGSEPSVMTLPILQDLQKLYGDRNLEIIAVNVGENDRGAVAEFLQKQGKDITHSVAFVPSGDTFQTEWVEAAKVTKLPFTFIVRDGRYLFGGHPAELTGVMIEGFLAGGDQMQAMLDEVERAKIANVVITDQLKTYSAAQRDGDADAMQQAVAAIASNDPDFIHLPRMLVDIELVRKNWSTANASLKAIDDPQMALMCAALISRKYDTADERPPAELYATVAEILAANTADDPSVKASLARVQWILGRNEDALATARLAAAEPGQFAKAPFEAYAKSFESDAPQSLEDLIKALAATANQPGQ